MVITLSCFQQQLIIDEFFVEFVHTDGVFCTSFLRHHGKALFLVFLVYFFCFGYVYHVYHVAMCPLCL